MENVKLKEFRKTHKGITKLSYEVNQILEGDPNGSPLYALFGLSNIEKFNIQKILNLMKKKGIIYLRYHKYYLTDKGKQQYRNALFQETERISKIQKKYKNWKPPRRISKIAWGLFGIIALIILIILIIYVGPVIYDFIVNLIE